MAVWYENLYMGINAAPLYDQIYRSIEEEEYMPEVYLITIAAGEKDQLDSFQSIQLMMPALRRRLQPIIGVALGKEEAMTLLQDIARDVYEKTGDLYLRKYFEEKLRKQQETG